MSVTHAGVETGIAPGSRLGVPAAGGAPVHDGRAEYAAALGLLPAPLTRRAIAFGIDLAFVAILSAPVVIALVSLAGYAAGSNGAAARVQPGLLVNLILLAAGALVSSAAVALQLVAHGRMGVTVGKAFVGIRSVNVASFDRPGFWRVVLRALVFQCSIVIVPLFGGVVMAISPLWDREGRGRGWLDIVGGTWLIDVTNGVNPYDARAMRRALRHADASDRGRAADEALPPLAAGPRHENTDRSPLFSPGFRLLAAAGAEPRSGSDALVKSVIVFDSGARYEVAKAGLIGRDPHTSDGESGMELVSILDDSLSVSKTHAEFGIDERGFWIGDRGSRNGTAIRSADGTSVAVDPGRRAYVLPTDTVFLGARSFAVRGGAERIAQRSQRRPSFDP